MTGICSCVSATRVGRKRGEHLRTSAARSSTAIAGGAAALRDDQRRWLRGELIHARPAPDKITWFR